AASRVPFWEIWLRCSLQIVHFSLALLMTVGSASTHPFLRPEAQLPSPKHNCTILRAILPHDCATLVRRLRAMPPIAGIRIPQCAVRRLKAKHPRRESHPDGMG